MSGDLRISIDDGESTDLPSTKHDTTAARAFAERDRAVAEREQMHRFALDAQESAMASGAAAAKAEADAAQLEHQAAFEMGDSAKLAEAQRKIARAEARAIQFDEARANLEAQRRTFSRSVASDPVEAAIAQASPRAQSWLREHKEYVTDRKLSMKASAAHNMALSEGHAPDSDAYFDFCEKFLGLRECGSARSRSQNSTALEDGARVLHVNPDGPLPPGAVKLSKREFELATEVLTWETGPKRGQPLGIREYLRRRRIQEGPEWQRLD